jgi:hypothetical protein
MERQPDSRHFVGNPSPHNFLKQAGSDFLS